MFAFTHTHTHTHTHKYIHAYTQVPWHTSTHILTRTHTLTHEYTVTHEHTRVLVVFSLWLFVFAEPGIQFLDALERWGKFKVTGSKKRSAGMIPVNSCSVFVNQNHELIMNIFICFTDKSRNAAPMHVTIADGVLDPFLKNFDGAVQAYGALKK